MSPRAMQYSNAIYLISMLEKRKDERKIETVRVRIKS